MSSPGDADMHDFLVDQDPVAQPTTAEVLSGSQLAGAPVPTQQPVLSTPPPLGPRQTRSPDRLTLSGPRPRHPAQRKGPKRARRGGHGGGVGGGDAGGDAGGAVGGG